MRTPIGMHYKFSDERIVYKMNADENGNLYVPVSGRNHSNSPTASYDWMVSVDGDTSVNYSGTGSDGGAITLSGYAAGSNHTITITPTTEEYGWALAYGWNNTTCAPLLTSVHYDGSYMGYGNSATQTGNYFRYAQYRGCTSLINAPAEVLPTSVTSIGTYFRREQYRDCTSLIATADEVLHNSITSVGQAFRYQQYYLCSGLTSARLIANNTVTTTNKRYQQFGNAGNTTNPMIITIYGNEMEADMQSNSCGLANANVSFIYVQPNLVEQYQQAAIRSNITDSKFVGY